MTDADAFIAAIDAAPDDDAPRLVYADWLQERGRDAHAEFIRLQCAIAPLMNTDPERIRLRERERKVWEVLRKQWSEFLSTTGAKRDWFHRGFMRSDREVRPDPVVFAATADGWWPWHPVGWLAFYPLRSWEGVLNTDYLGRVPRIYMSHEGPPFPGAALERLTRHHMSRVRELWLGTFTATYGQLIQLAEAPWLEHIEGIRLTVQLSPAAELEHGGSRFLSLGTGYFRYDRQPARATLLADITANRHLLDYPSAD